MQRRNDKLASRPVCRITASDQVALGIRESWLMTTPGGQNHSPGNLVDGTPVYAANLPLPIRLRDNHSPFVKGKTRPLHRRPAQPMLCLRSHQSCVNQIPRKQNEAFAHPEQVTHNTLLATHYETTTRHREESAMSIVRPKPSEISVKCAPRKGL